MNPEVTGVTMLTALVTVVPFNSGEIVVSPIMVLVEELPDIVAAVVPVPIVSLLAWTVVRGVTVIAGELATCVVAEVVSVYTVVLLLADAVVVEIVVRVVDDEVRGTVVVVDSVV